jgi:hypothetical protein
MRFDAYCIVSGAPRPSRTTVSSGAVQTGRLFVTGIKIVPLTKGGYAQHQCAWFASEQFLAKAHTAIATPLR